MVSPGIISNVKGRISSGLNIRTLGVSTEEVSGAGDAPPGVSSFRGSARKDTGGKWGSLGLVTGVLGERGALQGASKIRHSARGTPLLVSVLWDMAMGFKGKRG